MRMTNGLQNIQPNEYNGTRDTATLVSSGQ